jgi:hypothetical protein
MLNVRRPHAEDRPIEALDGRSSAAEGRPGPTLTVTLTSLTVGLVLLSIGAVVAVVSISGRQTRDDIELRYGRTSTFALNEALARHLAPAAPLLAEARQRAEALRRDPPPADWDGTYQATSK